MSDSTSQWFGMTRLQLADRLSQLSAELRNLPTFEDVPATRIDRWCLARRMVPCLIGTAASHPRISDGKPMFSSELFFMDVERGVARCFSRWYELGEQVQPGYWEKRFPRQEWQ